LTARKRGKARPSRRGKRARNTGENTGAQSSADRPQDHGGSLQTGNPGNAGGGRIPSEVRQLALEKFANRLDRLDQIAGGELTAKVMDRKGDVHEIPPPIKEQRLAIEALGKLGGMAIKIEHEGLPQSPLAIGVLMGPEAAAEMGLLPPTAPGGTP
jgi:hypothetical protein